MSQYLEAGVREFLQNRNICLIGFMGAGKSFLGEILANELDTRLFDTDKMLEKQTGMTIFEIFKEKGEQYFRAAEKSIVENIVFSCPEFTDSQTVSQHQKILLVTGGGLPLKKANQRLLKVLTPFYICLNPPFEVILSRVRGSKRPLVYRRSRQTIFNLWSERYRLYQNLANITISEVDITEIFKTLNQRVGMI